MDTNTIDRIMGEIGPLVKARDVSSYSGDGPDIWVIDFEDEPACQIEPVGDAGRHTLSGSVAAVPQEGRLELFQTLLLYNDQVETTGGVRMAIDAPDGDVLICVDLDPQDIEPQALTEAIAGFRAMRRTWKGVIEGWTAEGGDPPAPGGAPGIRV